MAEEGAGRARSFNKIVNWFRRVPDDDWFALGCALAIKVLLLVLGFKALAIFDNKRISGFEQWLQLWNRWDSKQILAVAQMGYSKGAHLVIYPLYPWLVRASGFVTGQYFHSAMMISAISLFAAVLVFRRLVLLDYSGEVAQRAVWFFLIFPTAYFLHTGYTEAFFLLLVFTCFLAARTDRWAVAGVVGALACMTRANGLALIPALVVEAVQKWRTGPRKWRWSWLWILVVPLGFGVFLLINLHVAGSALAWFETRRQHFRTSPAPPWHGIMEAINNLHRHPSQAEIVGFQELFFVALTFVCVVASWWKLRPVYATWITVNWLGFASLSFIQSAPRYALSCFPIFILFGLLGKNRFCLAALSAWSLLFLALFSILFARGWWAF